jgi:hypothetical protein
MTSLYTKKGAALIFFALRSFYFERLKINAAV